MSDVHGVSCLIIATTDMISILDTESFKILPDKYEVILFKKYIIIKMYFRIVLYDNIFSVAVFLSYYLIRYR